MTTVNGEYIPSPTPKPHPRIKPEAASYADRNRGGLERWFDYSGNDNYESPRPAGRTVTVEGQKNAEMNKGCMSEIMGGYADPPIERVIHPRGVKAEAQEIAEQNKGGGMRNLIENYGNLGLSDRPGPKVHGYQAEEYAERNHGVVDNLMNNYGNHTPEAPPPQKVSYGGEEVAAKHQGAGMGPVLRMEGEKTPHEAKQGLLHKESQGPGWDENPPAVRMRPEAEDIMDKNSQDQMGNLMRGEVDPPTVRETKTLKHLQVTETPRPQTSPLRTRPEAMHNYHKNQSSEMSAIMHGESSSGTPVRKVNRMMQRSENW